MPKFFGDIRFFIVLAFALRLFNITLAPVEVGHNWRRTTVLMVARNFVEGGFDLLHPRVDMAGELTGITGMEFPLLNAAHAAVSEVVGYDHWYGRLIVLIFSSWAMWSLFALLRRVLNARWAHHTVLILLVSLWFIYSRKVMPDVFSCSLVILGVHAFVLGWEAAKKYAWFLWSALGALAITAGLLSKLPSGILLAGMVPFLPGMKGDWTRKASLVLLLPGLTFTCWWYFRWVPHLVEEYGFWHFFMGKPAGEGLADLAAQPGEVLKHFYDRSLKYVGFVAAVSGVVVLVRAKQWRVLLSVGAALVALAVIAVRAGDTFVRHDYYMIPFIPFLALLAGYALTRLPKMWMRVALLAIIAIEGVGNRVHDFFPSASQRALLTLEAEVDHAFAPDARIVINSGENPAPLYFAHRKGWVMRSEEIQAREPELRTLGCAGAIYMTRSWREGNIPTSLVTLEDQPAIIVLWDLGVE